MNGIILQCWTCRKRLPSPSAEPQMACDIIRAAHEIGLMPFFDYNHQRVLIFCSDLCAEHAMTKNKRAFKTRRPKERTKPPQTEAVA